MLGQNTARDAGRRLGIGRGEMLGDARRAPARRARSERPLQPSSSAGTTPTQYGSALGTPANMSPEQVPAAGSTNWAPASDVYSLGATLYVLLDGQGFPRLRAATWKAMLRDAMEAGRFPLLVAASRARRRSGPGSNLPARPRPCSWPGTRVTQNRPVRWRTTWSVGSWPTSRWCCILASRRWWLRAGAGGKHRSWPRRRARSRG